MPSPKKEPIRWSIQHASIEFGTSPPTLSKALSEASIAPAADGTYSTQEICQALFGSLFRERLRRMTEEADKVALANAVSRGELLNRSELMQALAGSLFLRQRAPTIDDLTS